MIVNPLVLKFDVLKSMNLYVTKWVENEAEIALWREYVPANPKISDLLLIANDWKKWTQITIIFAQITKCEYCGGWENLDDWSSFDD